MKSIQNFKLKVLLCAAVLLALQAAPFFNSRVVAQVSEADNRSLIMSESGISATNVEYVIQFDFLGSNSVGSLKFQYCQNSPVVGVTCNAPSGFSASSVTLANQTGETGFTISGPDSTANVTVLTRTPSVTNPGTARYVFRGITNGSNIGTSYIRISSHASTDGTGPNIDEGGIAMSWTGGLALNTEVPPYLLFCTGISITGTNCSTATGSVIDLGDFSPSNATAATSQMVAATNADSGMAITVIGSTLTSGNFTIDPLTAPTASQPGTNQFGMNLRDNNNPNVGANRSGPGITGPTANYSQVDRFTFNNGDVVAQSNNETDINKLTASYIVNIDPDQRPGIYSTTVSYLCLATF